MDTCVTCQSYSVKHCFTTKHALFFNCVYSLQIYVASQVYRKCQLWYSIWICTILSTTTIQNTKKTLSSIILWLEAGCGISPKSISSLPRGTSQKYFECSLQKCNFDTWYVDAKSPGLPMSEIRQQAIWTINHGGSGAKHEHYDIYANTHTYSWGHTHKKAASISHALPCLTNHMYLYY